MIKYKNSFWAKFNEIKRLAKKSPSESELDTSTLTRDVRFFYPYEVQITDLESHKQNTGGEASHQECKKSQLDSARIRLFGPLIELKKA